MDQVYVNSHRVPIIHQIRLDKIRDLMRGSVLIVAHDCYIPEAARRYFKSKDIQVVRLIK